MHSNTHCLAVTDLAHGIHVMPHGNDAQLYAVTKTPVIHKLRFCLRHSFAWRHWREIKKLVIADCKKPDNPSILNTQPFKLWIG